MLHARLDMLHARLDMLHGGLFLLFQCAGNKNDISKINKDLAH